MYEYNEHQNAIIDALYDLGMADTLRLIQRAAYHLSHETPCNDELTEIYDAVRDELTNLINYVDERI